MERPKKVKKFVVYKLWTFLLICITILVFKITSSLLMLIDK